MKVLSEEWAAVLMFTGAAICSASGTLTQYLVGCAVGFVFLALRNSSK